MTFILHAAPHPHSAHNTVKEFSLVHNHIYSSYTLCEVVEISNSKPPSHLGVEPETREDPILVYTPQVDLYRKHTQPGLSVYYAFPSITAGNVVIQITTACPLQFSGKISK